jgi:hypothetical protein
VLPARSLAPTSQQIEGAKDGTLAAMASDQIEHPKPVVVADDGFGVDHTRAHWQRCNGFGCEREALGEIAAYEPDGKCPIQNLPHLHMPLLATRWPRQPYDRNDINDKRV